MTKNIILEFKKVNKQYPLDKQVIDAIKDVSFTVQEGEFVSIIGPSGCGKSTIIKLLAGLITPSSGQILENGQTIHTTDHGRGVMFQQSNLFPWLTVEENIGFGLLVLNTPTEKRKEIIAHYIEVMGLHGFGKAYPRELSGGMQQRVALARMLATNPKILLMDEPFNALDMQTKRLMQSLLLQIWSHEPRTIIFVTHDVEEAIFMSDTAYIMSTHPGIIRKKVKIDLPRPRDLATEFLSDFIAIKQNIQKIVTKEALGFAKLNLEIYKNL